MRKGLFALKQKTYPAADFFIKSLSGKIKRICISIAFYGVTNEKDELKQKYIIQLNLIAISTFVINGTTGILFFFIVDISPGISFMLSAIMWLLPMYINRNGLKVMSRVPVVLLTLAALFVASCWYTHDTLLDSYFLIVAINSTFMFSPQERKWQMMSLFLAAILYIIESTSLQNYLPDYHTLKFNPATNIILLFGQIILVLIDVIIYTYINLLREKSLLAKQKKLEEIQARVQIQNEDLKTFSIAASHTMQTPLHVSTFFLDKVALNVKDEETQNNIGLIKNGLQQIDQLVSGLFSYNHIINIENEQIQFDAIDEINIILKNLKPKYEDATIIINKKIFIIVTNPLLFSTVMYNLIDNGLKYNHTNPEINIHCHITTNAVVFSVIDNGIGIPEKHFTTIFEPFKRIQNSTKSKAGNGLGLACAKRAAERMGGNLICQESNQSGSIFKLEIPLNKNQQYTKVLTLL